MAKRVSEINNKITADDKTKAAFKSAGKSATRFGKTTAKAAELARKAMRGVGVALAATAGATAAAGVAALRLTQKNAMLEDSAGKVATRLGIQVEELSRYRHMAQISGNTNGDLETSFQKLQKSVGDAGKGLATQRDALKALGIETKDIISLPVNEQFEAIAAGIQKIPESARRTQIAMDLMGRGGAKMLQSINLGTEAMAAMRAEADLLGVTITGESAASAAEFNDEMLRMQGVVTGITRLFTEELKPIFTVLLRQGKERMLENREAAESLAESIQERVVKGLRIALEVMRFFHNAWLGIKLVGSVALVQLSVGIEGLIKGLRALLFPLDILFEGMKALGKIENNPFDALENSLADFTAASVDNTKTILTEIETVNRAYDNAGKTVDNLNEKINEQRRLNKELGTTLTDPTGTAGQESSPESDPRVRKEEQVQTLMADIRKRARGQEQLDINNDVLKGIFRREQEVANTELFFTQKLEKLREAGATELELEQSMAEQRMAIQELQKQSAIRTGLDVLKFIGKSSKTAFNIYKAFAIAQAAVDTIKAAQGAYSAMAGIPIIGPFLGVAAAAVAVAAGLARVRQIRAMSPGGSAAVSAGGGGAPPSPATATAPTASPEASPSAAGATSGPGQVVNIVVQGDALDKDGLARSLADSTKKLALRDGVRFGFATTGEATGA